MQVHAAQEALACYKQVQQIAAAKEAWAGPFAAEQSLTQKCLGHFKEATEKYALRSTCSKPSPLPTARTQALPPFSLQNALERLPSQNAVTSPR